MPHMAATDESILSGNNQKNGGLNHLLQAQMMARKRGPPKALQSSNLVSKDLLQSNLNVAVASTAAGSSLADAQSRIDLVTSPTKFS